MPQQRRAQVTRHVITVAAAEEFDRAGYDATPLSAILRRSGLTKGAFYFHFPSKEALAVALIRLQRRRWSRMWWQWMRRDLDPLSVAVGVIGEVARLIEADVVIRSGTWLASREVVTDQANELEPLNWEEQFARLLRRSAQRGLLRSGVDPVMAARVVCTGLIGAQARGTAKPGIVRRTEEFRRVLLEGIATSEWLRRHRTWSPEGRYDFD